MKTLFTTFLTLFLFNQSSMAQYPTSEDLIEKYPNISEASQRAEKKEILCPFWRLIERSGALDAVDRARSSDVMISIRQLTRKAQEFGCKWIECGAVGSLVSGGQLTHIGVTSPLHVNISKLHKARGVAHECGLTFEKGGTKVSEVQRATTLARLKKLSDAKNVPGILHEEDLMKVKLQICQEQGVKITKAGSLEVGLIYSFLGGKDRGFIEYEDVVRFFHAEMPKTKAINKI